MSALSEYDYEPEPGLPEPLPLGEHLVWQGAPSWRHLALRGFPTIWVWAYFGALMAWTLWDAPSHDVPLIEAFRHVAALGLAGVAATALIMLYAYLVARSTLYTITTKRVVLRHGLALPMMINLPFALIERADLRRRADGSGDIVLTLVPTSRIAGLALWPHVKPWSWTRPRPMLRALGDAAPVARLLGEALAESLGQPAPIQAGGRAPARAARDTQGSDIAVANPA